MARCMIPNCRKLAPADDPFCVDHRDRPDLPAGFSVTLCAIGVNRSGMDAGHIDYAIDCEALSRIDLREFLEILDAIRNSATVQAALRRPDADPA